MVTSLSMLLCGSEAKNFGNHCFKCASKCHRDVLWSSFYKCSLLGSLPQSINEWTACLTAVLLTDYPTSAVFVAIGSSTKDQLRGNGIQVHATLFRFYFKTFGNYVRFSIYFTVMYYFVLLCHMKFN